MCYSDNDADALSATYGYFEGYELRHMMVTIEGRDFHAYHQVGKRKRGRPKKLKQDHLSQAGDGGLGDGGFFSDVPGRPPQRPPAALLQQLPSVAPVPPSADAANPIAPPKPLQSPPPLPPPRDRSPGFGDSGGGVATAASVVAGKRLRSGGEAEKLTPTSKLSGIPPMLPSGDGGGMVGGVETEEETQLLREDARNRRWRRRRRRRSRCRWGCGSTGACLAIAISSAHHRYGGGHGLVVVLKQLHHISIATVHSAQHVSLAASGPQEHCCCNAAVEVLCQLNSAATGFLT